jgi:glutathione synthase/RimK-type ligase-like ATP-grasp enzyme
MKIAIVYDLIHPLLEVIKEGVERHGIDVYFVHWQSIAFTFSIHQTLPSIVMSGFSLEDFDAVYLDRMGEATKLYLSQVELFASVSACFSVPVINDPWSYRLARDKIASAFAFHSLNLTTPKTLVASNLEEIEKFCQVGKSYVLKPALGCCGSNVVPFSSPSEVSERASQLLEIEGTLLVQEFITQKDRFIWRIDLVDSEIIVANKRYSHREDELAICNGTLGGVVEFFAPDDVPGKVSDLAICAVKKLGLSLAGVDLLQADDEEIYLIEVNPEPDITMNRYEFPFAIAGFLVRLAKQRSLEKRNSDEQFFSGLHTKNLLPVRRR